MKNKLKVGDEPFSTKMMVRGLEQARADLSDAVAAMIFNGDFCEHSFEHSHEGDGWNEPFYDDYSCLCGDWSLTWVQTDPKQTGRPDPADALLSWFEHCVDAENKEFGSEGWNA